MGDRYRVIRLVGEGGMGRVFLAHDQQEDRQVAVKVLADDRPIPKAAERFTREAQSIAKIDHPNVVAVSGIGETPRGGLFYTMEYLEGEELADTLARDKRLPWQRAVHIALQICDGLQAAHEQGVVHRDLKLENCFRVTRDGDPDFIKILDFGIAKLLRPLGDEEAPDGRLTDTGATLGTPAYMAPELCRGRPVDHRVDVYALGIMLYELLTGVLPFRGEGFLDVAMLHMKEPPPRIREVLDDGEVPPMLEAAIRRALGKRRKERFPTMAAFGRALRTLDPADIGEEPNFAPAAAPSAPAPAASSSRTGQTEHLFGAMPPPALRPGVADASIESEASPSGSGAGLVAPGAAASGAHPGPGTRRGGVALAAAVALGVVAVVGAGLWWAGFARESGAESGAQIGSSSSSGARSPVDVSGSPREVALGVDTEGGAADEEELVIVPGEPEVEATGDEPPPGPSKPRARRRELLSRGQIRAALSAIQPRLRACAGSVMKVTSGQRVRLSLTVDKASGKVVAAEVLSRISTPARACIRDATLHARFPRVGARGTHTVRTHVTL